jgi:glycosyltransferase involved in cell wall biosynthesis
MERVSMSGRMSDARPNVLVICSDKVGKQMAGPAIRAYELAKALRPHAAEVTLAGLETEAEPLDDFDVVQYHIRDQRRLKPLIARADVILAQPHWPVVAAWMRNSGARLIYDLYDPEPLEVLESLSDRSLRLRRVLDTLTVDRIVEALHDGHHLVCASEKQRDLWLGSLMAERLIDPSLYDRDPSLRSLLDVVPFGLPAESPQPVPGAAGPRERFAGAIGPDDEVILWNGGIWNWLDAPTAVRAAAELATRRSQVRLVFMGASKEGAGRRAADEARAVARDLDVLDRHVFFNTEWVPYAQRGTWLLEADCAVSNHVEHLETRFAFRTRLLDCFWARLPVVCTAGDDLGALVERSGAGIAVPQRDVAATASALEQVLSRGRAAHKGALDALAERFAWPRVAEPLIGFVAQGRAPRRSRAAFMRRRPLQVGRGLAYRAGRNTLNAVGLKDWPTLY